MGRYSKLIAATLTSVVNLSVAGLVPDQYAPYVVAVTPLLTAVATFAAPANADG